MAEIFDRPQHAYTRHLLAAEPRGRPLPAASDAPVLAEVEGLKVWFPIKTGLLRRVTDHVKAVDGVSFELREGHTLGVVGESGSGKTTLGLAFLRLVASEGEIRFAGQTIDGLGSSAPAPAPAPDADRLPGSLRLPQPPHVGRGHRRAKGSRCMGWAAIPPSAPGW